MAHVSSPTMLQRPHVVRRLNRRSIVLVLITLGALCVLAYSRFPHAHDDQSLSPAPILSDGSRWLDHVPMPQETLPPPQPAPPILEYPHISPPPLVQKEIRQPTRQNQPANRRREILAAALLAPTRVESFSPGQTRTPEGARQTTSVGLLQPPPSEFMVVAGTPIRAELLTPVHSDHSGVVLAQVTEALTDSKTHTHVLIPIGSRLVGSTGSDVSLGQTRARVQWEKLILPNTTSVSLGSMPSADAVGRAGLPGTVNTHLGQRLFEGVLRATVLSGVDYSQRLAYGFRGGDPTIGESAGAVVGRAVGEAATTTATPYRTLQPTIEVPVGTPLTVIVTQNLIFPGPYGEEEYP